MEPLNSVASVSPNADAVEIWCGTQSQTHGGHRGSERARNSGSNALNSTARCSAADSGGAAIATRNSSSIGVDLQGDEKAGQGLVDARRRVQERPLPSAVRACLRAGLDAQGKHLAWHHRIVCDQVLAFQDPVRNTSSKGRDNIAMRGSELQDLRHSQSPGRKIFEDTGIRTSSLRAIGVGPNKFASEVFLDEIATSAASTRWRCAWNFQEPAARPRGGRRSRAHGGMGSKRDGRGAWFCL